MASSHPYPDPLLSTFPLTQVRAKLIQCDPKANIEGGEDIKDPKDKVILTPTSPLR